MKKHIVIALGDYYPTPSANGICIIEIVRAFIKRGYYVDVISNDIDAIKKPVKTRTNEVFFVSLPIIQRIEERLNIEKDFKIKVALSFAKLLLLALRLPLLKQTYPIISKARCRKIEKKICLIAKHNDVVAIIGVHKPIEAVYGACNASIKTEIPFFGYFLDPLVGGYQNRHIRARKLIENTEGYEKKIIKASRKTIYMNSHYTNVVKRYKKKISDNLVFLGPPLLKEHYYRECTKQNDLDIKKVVYAGSVYKDIRNPRYIMDVFKYVKNAKLEMYIPSPAEWVYQCSNDNIEIHSGITHDEMKKVLEKADVLLNIGNSTSLCMPSKIIEYLSLKKPIISTYRIDEDTCIPYMEKYPNSLSIDERELSVEDAARMIDCFVKIKPRDVTFDDLREVFYINTPEAFVETVLNHITI